MFNIMEITNMNNKNDIRFKIKKRKTSIRVRNARIRAVKYCIATSSIMGIFVMCLSIALQQ